MFVRGRLFIFRRKTKYGNLINNIEGEKTAFAGGKLREAMGKSKIYRRIAAVIIVAAFLIYLLDAQVRPIIITYANYQSRVSAILVMNEAISEFFNEKDVQFESLIKINHTPDGRVSSIETDSAAINRLKSTLTNNVAQKLNSLGQKNISVPIGTVLGLQFLAGRGPRLTFKILPAAYVESEISNTFTTAGINQTQLKIYIKFKVDVIAIIPGYTTSTTVQNEVCIAETLIVGSVPELYSILSSAGIDGAQT